MVMKRFFVLQLQKVLILVTSLLPAVSYAQYANKDSVQGYILLIISFINNAVLPLIFAIALLFFLVNAARYFILEGDDSAGREKARTMALYGIGAFVIIVSIWGIVNMFVYGLGIGDNEAICPDYLDGWCNYSGYGGQNSPSEYGQGPGNSNNNTFYDWSINFEFN